MGLCLSSSSTRADWAPVSPCGCGYQHYCAAKMQLRAHPLEPVNQTLLAPLLKRPEHDAVRIYFVCAKCGKENKCTYELTGVGKHSRWEYYGRSLKIVVQTKLNVSYETVEDIFRGMWKKYNLKRANCQHWALDFFNRVGKESTEAFDTYREPIGSEIFFHAIKQNDS
uniref:Uncharacterized protein n=1 Tax=Globodera rostochiensis TaxID=31243 RepID=A0A914HU68_GLORO